MMHHLSRAPRNNHFSLESQGQYGADICSIDLPPKPTSMNLFSFSCSCVVHDRMIRLAFHLAWSILHPFELTAAWLVRCSADYFDCCYRPKREPCICIMCVSWVYPGWLVIGVRPDSDADGSTPVNVFRILFIATSGEIFETDRIIP